MAVCVESDGKSDSGLPLSPFHHCLDTVIRARAQHNLFVQAQLQPNLIVPGLSLVQTARVRYILIVQDHSRCSPATVPPAPRI